MSQSPQLGSMAGHAVTAELAEAAKSTNVDEEMQVELESPQAMPQEERFRQLQQLLNRSKFYTKYLAEKINTAEIKMKTKLSVAATKTNNPSADRVLRGKTPVNDSSTVSSKFYGSTSQSGSKRRKLEENIQEDPIVKLAPNFNSSDQPTLLTGATLRAYQLEGYNWLRVLYENGINGILGDEMGLGKTIQCIALISHVIEMGVPGPFLICAPLSTLTNWVSEFKRFAPLIPTLLYHGSVPERAVKRKELNRKHPIWARGCYPIMLTSYEIVMRDVTHLKKYVWEYIIVDEGHRIKNYECLLVKCLKALKSRNRILLTGTPLQNNLTELWSLLNFVLPEIFDNLKIFHSWFDMSKLSDEGSDEYIIAQEQEKHVLETLHEILTPFLLRRLKADVELCIPPKREMLVYAPFTKKQNTFYKATVDRTIRALVSKEQTPDPSLVTLTEGRPKRRDSMNNDLLEYKSTRSYVKEAKMLDAEVSLRLGTITMALRKCCSHPYMIEYPFEAGTNAYLVDEELVRCSGKMLVLDLLLKKLKERGHKVLIFSQMTSMLDILRDYCYLRGYIYCILDGRMDFMERQEQIKQFNEIPESFIFLVSTRAGGLGINLTAADTAIIYDSDWNPQCDLQAMDRCHRIGQTKPVIVFRLVTANTIDQRMVERAAAKRKLEKIVIHKDKFKKVGSGPRAMGFTLKELTDMLKSTDHDGVVYSGTKNLFTPEELEMLLDRSFTGKRDISSSTSSTAISKVTRVKILDEEDGEDGETNRDSTPDE